MIFATQIYFSILTLIVIFENTIGPNVNDYCKIKCSGYKHTLCRYGPSCGTSGMCNLGINQDSPQVIAEYERELILYQHNKFRNRIANGKLRLPAAANMYELKWNEELAKSAQCWVNQCKNRRDDCRDFETGSVGQNIELIRNIHDFDSIRDINLTLSKWESQLLYFEMGYIISYPVAVQVQDQIDFVSQMIWAKTTEIGCGKLESCVDEYRMLFACNYFPAGAVPKHPIYMLGSPASKCRHGESITYSGLCKIESD